MDEDVRLFSGFFDEIVGEIEVLKDGVILPVLGRNVEVVRDFFFFMINEAAPGHWEDGLDAETCMLCQILWSNFRFYAAE